MLCDITLIVEDVHFKAHKALLAASSEYFSVLFTAEDQAGQAVYRLDGMAAKTFESVLEFIYSANVSVEDSSTEQLLDMARLLEISELVKAHADFQFNSTATLSNACSDSRDVNTSTNETLSKRKRGRPRKNTTPLVPGLVLLPQESSEKENGHEPAKTTLDSSVALPESKCNLNPLSNNLDDADYNPNEDRTRGSRRRIRQPVKLKNYTLENEIREGKVLGKRGRKRKYPATEPRCDDCGKVFKNHLFLKIHQRTHTGEKPFTCEICGKCFTTKSTLQTHIRIHRGEKPYECNMCSKSFSDPSARRRHVASHTGKKSYTCSVCSLSFTRLDNLKAHIKTHNKERVDVEGTPLTTVETVAVNEKMHNVLELQQYHLPCHNEQGIQLVVTSEVDNIDLMAGQKPGSISIITAENGPEELTATGQTHSSLTLLTHPSTHIQNLALVTQDETDSSAPIQTISVVEGQVSSEQAEQMHVITLTKEAMEHFQVQHEAPQQLQISSRPLHQLQVIQQAMPQLSATEESLKDQHNQSHTGAIRISSQAGQPISISQTSEQISSTQIQGQTFQIQAGMVSYLYTTSQTPQS
ncbi:Zinc finger and BTB domain-containing protein 24 [Bagarius yarrelli]|uniref:Zinc finger and BTB domain-containing protein 24 n=1 Tax=Bagarius yarrelli TaxID=175774 RepID=A0A556U950_BAGYA|nr:Zinc finger and BTB domain-containing protein 24 [Bagarius yarrelli]